MPLQRFLLLGHGDVRVHWGSTSERRCYGLMVKRFVGKVSGRQRSESPATWVFGQLPVVG